MLKTESSHKRSRVEQKTTDQGTLFSTFTEYDNTSISGVTDCGGSKSISTELDSIRLATKTPYTQDQISSVATAQTFDKNLKFWPDLDRRLNGIKQVFNNLDDAIIRNASLFAVLAAAGSGLCRCS